MKIDEKKKGRPSDDEGRPKLLPVAFKIDLETKAALDKLVEHAKKHSGVRLMSGSKSGGIRSAVIRQAILDAAGQI